MVLWRYIFGRLRIWMIVSYLTDGWQHIWMTTACLSDVRCISGRVLHVRAVTYLYISCRDPDIRYDMEFCYHGNGAIFKWPFCVISWKISTWSTALSTPVLRTEHMKSRTSTPSGRPSRWSTHCTHATDGCHGHRRNGWLTPEYDQDTSRTHE